MPALKTPSVPALERALSVLELLARTQNGLTLPELTRRLSLPKSSVHCLLLTLERRGYLLRQAPNGRYLFGSRLFSLGNQVLNGLALRETAAPHLRDLMERTHLTVHLAVLEGGEAVLIAKAEPPGASRLATWPGKRMDLHSTGVGKALLAYLPEAELARLLGERGLPRRNENSITSTRKLREELATVRRLGYALDDEEDEIGLRCIGAPVFDPAGGVAAAISVSGSIIEVREENRAALAAQVVATAAVISRTPGYGPAAAVQGAD